MIKIPIPALVSGIHEAMVIWLVLVVAAVCVPVLITLPPRARAVLWAVLLPWRSVARWRRRRARARLIHHQVAERQREEARRYAEELAVAARRAAVTAERLHAEWVTAQRFKEATWQAYDAADRSARSAARASAFPVPGTALTEADLASRDRLLRRSAIEAFRCGYLSTEQLSDLLLHRRGWELHRHPCEHETKLRLVGQARLLYGYLTASAIERTAWHRAEVAATAKRALVDEAFHAAMRAAYVAIPASPRLPGRTANARATRPVPAIVRPTSTASGTVRRPAVEAR